MPWRKPNGDASIPAASMRSREMDLKTLEKQALRLSAEDRAALAQKLLLSLEDMPASELDEMWLLEAERRARQLDRGEVQPVPADEVRRKAKALLR
jgi:putative addiction module component (TIGR02574 family)